MGAIETKLCKKCGEVKDLSEFSGNDRTRRQPAVRCKACTAVYAAERTHGLSPEQYKRLQDDAGGACLICGGTNGDGKLYIDHCHETGKVRGLLCARCNSMLGMAQDNVERLRAAADYLEGFK